MMYENGAQRPNPLPKWNKYA